MVDIWCTMVLSNWRRLICQWRVLWFCAFVIRCGKSKKDAYTTKNKNSSMCSSGTRFNLTLFYMSSPLQIISWFFCCADICIVFFLLTRFVLFPDPDGQNIWFVMPSLSFCSVIPFDLFFCLSLFIRFLPLPLHLPFSTLSIFSPLFSFSSIAITACRWERRASSNCPSAVLSSSMGLRHCLLPYRHFVRLFDLVYADRLIQLKGQIVYCTYWTIQSCLSTCNLSVNRFYRLVNHSSSY